MPLLPAAERLEKIELPSTKNLEDENDRAWVVIDLSPARAGDVELLDQTMADGAMSIAVMTPRIREWNYTDSQGKPVEITYENVKCLNSDDFKYLTGLIDQTPGALSDEEKKASTPTSTQSITVETLE